MEDKIAGVSHLPVLIVDDVSSARAVLSDMLKELGFAETIQASNGSEALEVLKTTPTQLILCDFLMEGMNGIEFLNHLHEHHPSENPPVIFVSALGDVSSVETAMGQGATDYLVKPVSFRKLKRKIEHALAAGSYSHQHGVTPKHGVAAKHGVATKHGVAAN
jgi:two-component system chemotaxis response regulator CheY